jgi:hypothetical protein
MIRVYGDGESRYSAAVGDVIYVNDVVITSDASMLLANTANPQRLITINPLASVQFTPSFIDQLGNADSFNNDDLLQDDGSESNVSLLDTLLSKESIESILPSPSAPNANEPVAETGSRPGVVVIWERTGTEILPFKGFLALSEDDLFNLDEIGDQSFLEGDSIVTIAQDTNAAPLNDAPDSADKTITLAEDNDYVLLRSDFAYSDTEGDSFANVRIDELPTSGQLTFSGLAVTANQTINIASIMAGDLVFVPEANANGSGYSSFTFSVQDSAGAFDATPNTITIDVTPVVDLLVPKNDSYEVIVDTPFTSTLANGVLFNDAGDDLSVDTTPISNVANGVLALNDDGTFTYTPNDDYNGSDSFIYQVEDDLGNTAQATVNINVDYVKNTVIGTSAEDNLIGAAASDDDIFSGGVNSFFAENIQGVGGSASAAQGASVGSGNDRFILDADDAFVTDASASEVDGGLIRFRDFTVGDVTMDTDADTLVLGDFLRAGVPTFDGSAEQALNFLHFENASGSRAQLLYIDRDGGLVDAASRNLSEGNVYGGIDGGASLLLEFKTDDGLYDATPGGEVLNSVAQIQSLIDLGFLDFS